MPTKIQLKRGTHENLGPVILSAGEPAFTLDTGKLYIGNETDKVLINPIDKPVGLDTGNFYTRIQVNDFGQVVAQAYLIEEDIPNLPISKISGFGTAVVADVGISSGNVPVLDSDGKLSYSVIPPLAGNHTYIVDSEDAMTGLPANVGDIVVRTDISESFVLQAAPPSDLSGWVQLLVSNHTILSVNDQTGPVVLTASDLQMSSYDLPLQHEPVTASDSVAQAVGKLETNFNNYAALDSPVLTGMPQAPTPENGDNSSRLATTAFVENVLSVIDGGVF